MTELPDLSCLTHEEKDALIRALWAQVQALTARVADLEARLGAPQKTPANSSVPPSKGKKPNRPEKSKHCGPRPGSLGRVGGGRMLTATPDEIVVAKPVRCAYCQAAFGEADHVLHGRYDKIDLPKVSPVVTRVEHYAGCCGCCCQIVASRNTVHLGVQRPYITGQVFWDRQRWRVFLPAFQPAFVLAITSASA